MIERPIRSRPCSLTQLLTMTTTQKFSPLVGSPRLHLDHRHAQRCRRGGTYILLKQNEISKLLLATYNKGKCILATRIIMKLGNNVHICSIVTLKKEGCLKNICPWMCNAPCCLWSVGFIKLKDRRSMV